MSGENLKETDFINAKDALRPQPNRDYKPQPRMDKEVSQILGKNVPATHPKLIELANRWNSQRKDDDLSPANNLKDPEKVKELKKAFNVV